MLIEQTVEKLHSMRLLGMAGSLKTRLTELDQSEVDAATLVGFIVDDEWAYRENRRLSGLLKHARFKEKAACLENIDYQAHRGLKKSVVVELGHFKWIDNHQNLAITGPCGIGKSYLAQALGNQACRRGYSVAYYRIPKLSAELTRTRADGSYVNFLKRIGRTRMLILDELGTAPLTEKERQDLLEILEDRYSMGSTVVTSQVPTSEWHACFGKGLIADSICDRLLHNAHRIELKGESMRKLKAKLTEPDQQGKS